MKQIVHYSTMLLPPIVGCRATVVPVDHPDNENVTNGMPVHTTRVVSIDGTTFETLNTRYVPLEH